MNFSVDKCKILNLGRNNLNSAHTGLGPGLAVTAREGDLGVAADCFLKMPAWCAAVTRKAKTVVGGHHAGDRKHPGERHCDVIQDHEVPHPECCVPVWSLHLGKDVGERE